MRIGVGVKPRFVRQSAPFQRLAIASLFALVLTGCGVSREQLEAAGTFGQSAAALATGTKAAYAQAAQDELTVRTATYVVLSARTDVDDPTPIKNRAYRTPLVRLGPKDIAGRYAAAAALAAYGEALATLLDSKTQEGDLATASDKFTTALKGIPATTLAEAKITTADIDFVGKVITTAGDLYLDYRRRQVLEQVVPKAAPIVNKLCSLFASDFDLEGGVFATVFTNDIDDVLASTERALSRRGGSLQDRAILLPIYQQTTSIRSKSAASFQSLQEAANSCVKSNKTLAKSISDPTTSLQDIIDFATKAQKAYAVVNSSIGLK